MNVTILSARRARLAAAGAAVAACAMALAPVGAQAAVDCGPEADQIPTANRDLQGRLGDAMPDQQRAAGPWPCAASLLHLTSRLTHRERAQPRGLQAQPGHGDQPFRSHTGSDGSTRESRLAPYGGKTGEILYSWEGSGGTPRAAVNAWMKSKAGHRETILDPGFREFGSAASHLEAVTGNPGGTYTVTFGGR